MCEVCLICGEPLRLAKSSKTSREIQKMIQTFKKYVDCIFIESAATGFCQVCVVPMRRLQRLENSSSKPYAQHLRVELTQAVQCITTIMQMTAPINSTFLLGSSPVSALSSFSNATLDHSHDADNPGSADYQEIENDPVEIVPSRPKTTKIVPVVSLDDSESDGEHEKPSEIQVEQVHENRYKLTWKKVHVFYFERPQTFLGLDCSLCRWKGDNISKIVAHIYPSHCEGNEGQPVPDYKVINLLDPIPQKRRSSQSQEFFFQNSWVQNESLCSTREES